MLITELLAGLGLGAKAVLGIGIAATSVTAAGVAIVLPPAADQATNQQNTEAPNTEKPASTVGGADAEVVADIDADIDAEPVTEESAAPSDGAPPPEAASFGTTVADDARDGGVDGQDIAAQAREQSQIGLATAGQTPAAGHVPTAVPTPAGPPSNPGVGAASKTPAAEHLPAGIPSGPPADSPAAGRPTGRP